MRKRPRKNNQSDRYCSFADDAEAAIREYLRPAVESHDNHESLVRLFKAFNDYAWNWLQSERKFQLRREMSDLFAAGSAVISRELNAGDEPSSLLAQLVSVLEKSQGNRRDYGVEGLASLPTPRLHITATGGERGCRTLYVTISAGLICSHYYPTVVQGNYSVTGCGCGSFAESDMMAHLKYPIGSSALDLKSLQQTQFAYLHVQRYHPILKVFCSERGAVGFRDMMKLAVVLADPYQCDRQFIGVWDRRLMKPMAKVLRARKCVVAGAIVASRTIDEFTREAYVFAPRGETKLIARQRKGIQLPQEGLSNHTSSALESATQLEVECAQLGDMFRSSRSPDRSARTGLVVHNAALALAAASTTSAAPTWNDVCCWRAKIAKDWTNISQHARDVMGMWAKLTASRSEL